MENLQGRWKYLYAEYLPALARAKDVSQPKWPVCLDHCFARIVLDNAVGKDKPWTEVVKSPAIKHMTEVQFQSAISMAEKIASGEEDLAELDERSLSLRGKKSKRKAAQIGDDNGRHVKKKSKTNGAAPAVKNRKTKDETISFYFLPSPASPQPEQERDRDDRSTSKDATSTSDPPDMSAQLTRIQNSSLTPFRKQTLSLLCQIPRGRYSTYQAMSDHISRASHKTCARAVGNAMRNNPFAPEVPCHRILANDGSLGGFGGHWGEDGKFAGKKRELLKEEGVKFDSKGKVKGPPFKEWR